MKSANFLKENNARSLWHPMAHPADSRANPPTIITGAAASSVGEEIETDLAMEITISAGE